MSKSSEKRKLECGKSIRNGIPSDSRCTCRTSTSTTSFGMSRSHLPETLSMAEQTIDRNAAAIARERYPRAYLSGVGGPFGVVRLQYSGDRPAIVFCRTETEARNLAREIEGIVEKFSCPIPDNVPDLYPD
jgi:hypothetical protein